MDFLSDLRNGEYELLEWFYFLSLALILAFGTLSTAGTVMSTDKPVVAVVSCSMYPEYHRGDILFVQGQDFNDIEEGEVIVYKVPDRVDFSVDGESYTLEKDSPLHNTSVETSLGRVELVEVVPDLNPGQDGNTKDGVILNVDGERVRVEEGSSSNGLSVEKASAMPIPVVHRVVRKEDGFLETRGDANSRQLDFESDVRPFQVHGKAFFRVPRIGLFKMFAMDLAGFGDAPLSLDKRYTC